MERIKELRIENLLTQKQLAEKIGSTSKSIWAYENKIAVPPLDVLRKLADFFNCSIDYLANRSDDFGNITIQESTAPALNAEEQLLMNDFRALNRSDKVQVREYARYLAEKERGNK